MCHKLILTSLLVFLEKDMQMAGGMVVCYLYAIIILVRKPYYRKGDDRFFYIFTYQYIHILIFILIYLYFNI